MWHLYSKDKIVFETNTKFAYNIDHHLVLEFS